MKPSSSGIFCCCCWEILFVLIQSPQHLVYSHFLFPPDSFLVNYMFLRISHFFYVAQFVGIQLFKIAFYDSLNFYGVIFNASFFTYVLLIWVLFLFSLIRLPKGLLVLFIFSKNQLQLWLIFCVVFLLSIPFIFALIFTISFC